MLEDPKTPDPKIRPRCKCVLGTDFRSGSNVLTHCLAPNKVPSPGQSSLASGREGSAAACDPILMGLMGEGWFIRNGSGEPVALGVSGEHLITCSQPTLRPLVPRILIQVGLPLSSCRE